MYSVLAFLLELPGFKKAIGVPYISFGGTHNQYPNQLLQSHFFKHACKTPLTTLLCSLEHLTKTRNKIQSRHDEPRDQNVTMVRISMLAAQKLAEMIALLDSNADQVCDESFDVLHAIDEAVLLCRQNGTKRSVVVHKSCSSTNIRGIKLFFQEALSCLLNNSFEAYECSDEKLVIIYIKNDNTHLLIELVDFGCGMSEGALKLALVRGVSYKSTGSGLGLSFAEHVIRSNFGGQLSVTSKSGVGTRVTIKIPFNSEKLVDTQNHE